MEDPQIKINKYTFYELFCYNKTKFIEIINNLVSI